VPRALPLYHDVLANASTTATYSTLLKDNVFPIALQLARYALDGL